MRVTVVLLIFLSLEVLAQPTTEAVSGRLDALSTMQPNRSIPGLGFDHRSGTVRGSLYLTDDWVQGGVQLAGDTAWVEQLAVRFNLLDQALEIKSQTGIKLAYASNIKAFYLYSSQGTRRFVSGTVFRDEKGDQLPGFVEVLKEGTFPYLQQTTAYIKKPDYKEAFHMGSMDYQIIHTDKYFIADQGVVYPVHVFLKARRKRDPALRKFIAKNDLSIKEDADLARILKFLNKNEP
ncbi:hypothetical protein [Cesiribacter andamanensis]|uniref:Uncharacterized protein n=1 Tax=Cesiribacter andamanensis AMV16 TaxID=1279009 RepID=M7MXH9_9BACT|nr:hypothetical protein [Cesiribacter andamanensis]EMR01153.1 hypothetical protein ADICEAN_03718 [Cesiribacter andamanensis AMV16]